MSHQPNGARSTAGADVEMPDATADAVNNSADGAERLGENRGSAPTGREWELGASVIRMLPGDSDSAASFEISHEDHTLGNALRWVIMKNPDVEFCGYSIPHPSDPKMNFRIQTFDDATITVYDALEKGLDDLIDVCDVITDKFTEAKDEFGRQEGSAPLLPETTT